MNPQEIIIEGATYVLKNDPLADAWAQRNKLYAESNKFYVEGRKLRAESNKLYA